MLPTGVLPKLVAELSPPRTPKRPTALPPAKRTPQRRQKEAEADTEDVRVQRK